MNATKKPFALSLALAAAVAAAGCGEPWGPHPIKKDQVVDTCPKPIRAVGLPCEDPEVLEAYALLQAMTLEEKVQQMSGRTYDVNNMFDQADNKRLGIPGYRYMDGPRGVRWMNSNYGTTVFPVAAARASAWNLALEQAIGDAVADEMRFLGRHVLLAPTINQVMHPRWGRAQETYGEDSFLLGEMGAAFIKGAQAVPTNPADWRIQACAKHFAANNIDDQRIYVNALLDERTLREVYTPHFKRAVDEGVQVFMSSYNRVNGSYAGFSRDLVRDILKGEWEYTGWVVSDWFAKGNTISSPVAGLDVEMPFSTGPFPDIFASAYFYGPLLTTAVNEARVSEDLVNESVLRILYAKVRSGILTKWSYTDANPADATVQWVASGASWAPWLTKSDDSQAIALTAARQGIVLLKNGPAKALGDDVLPLDAGAVNKIVLLGKYGYQENMGDKGSSDAKAVDGEVVITPYEGLKEALGATNTSRTSCGAAAKCVTAVETYAGNEALAAAADVVVVVGAYYPADLARSSAGEEGEWKDRASMLLPQRDLDNINAAIALKATKPSLKIVVVMKSGGAVVVNPWESSVDAIVMAWFAGMKEGTALGEILFGAVNPSGKVVQSFPVAEADLPEFKNQEQGDVQYGYYHGYRWLDRQNKAAKYPFGHGLSYTTFQYSNLQVQGSPAVETGTVTVTVDVKNTGSRTGSEVVQLYVGFGNTALTDTWGRPKKELRAFARAEDLAPNETRTVTLTVKVPTLQYWDAAADAMKVEKIAYPIWVGPSSDTTDANTQQGTFTVQ